MLQDGDVIGAKLGDEAADLEQSLDTSMQMGYEIGCGVLPSTVLTLGESEVGKLDAVGKFKYDNLQSRLTGTENKVKPLQYAEQF